MKQLGDGQVIDIGIDPRDQELDGLRAENRRLQRAASDAEMRADRAKEDADRALINLRRQLGPLYRALQMVFGELDAAGVTDSAPASQPEGSASPGGREARELSLWNDWKAKLPPVCGKVIDALLLHSDLTAKQLQVTAQIGENSVYQATSRLGQAGLITKNGGRFSLKQL